MLRFDHYNEAGWRLAAALDRLDPGTHRRIKGLRPVTAFGLVAMLATVPGIAHGREMLLGTLAPGFALWASVSEARSTRYESARDLTLLCLAAGVGAASFAILAGWLGSGWAELTLVSGSFCVGYLKHFGLLGGGSVRNLSVNFWLTAQREIFAATMYALGVILGGVLTAPAVDR